jgi:hypothetical protein
MSKLKLSSNASGSGNVTLQSPNTNSDFTVTVPTGTGALPLMKLETAVASTSGTSINFTDIPSWAKRITVMFSGMSVTGSEPILQLGDAGGIETTGYAGTSSIISASAASTANYTTGFPVGHTAGGAINMGMLVLAKFDGNSWVASGNISRSEGTAMRVSAGGKTLSDTLDRLRITTANGTDTFDAGSINIMYEG